MTTTMHSTDAPIRVAFLGADDETAALMHAVMASPRFELIGICAPGPAAAGGAPGDLGAVLRPIAQWQALLDGDRVDAVIVACSDEEDLRAEQLRKLIQTETPLLASHPVVRSMLVYYELDMIRRATHSIVVPQLPGRKHPAALALAELARQEHASPIGKVEQISVERSIAGPTRQTVERAFARDVDLLRFVAGEMTRLGAMSGGSGAEDYASLGVQMSGPQGIAARWSVVPVQSGGGAKLTLTGARGRATVAVDAVAGPWTLELDFEGESRRQDFPGWDPAAAALDSLAAAMAGQPTEPDWIDACRSIELTETIGRSLQKGRTIELHFEEYTEEGTFKGTMTSLGCGLLLLGTFALVLVGVAEQMDIPYVKYWPYVLVVLFGVFLALQLVMLTSGKKQDESGEPMDEA